MQRRQFIALLGSGAALGITGLPSLLPEPPRRVVERMPLFVGLGNAGVNFVQALGEMTPREYQRRPRIVVEINRSDGKSALPLDEDDRAQLISAAIFSRHTREVSRVVLMASLSRSTGGAVISEVAERYMAEGAKVSIVGTLPFRFEGSYWRSEAERQLAVVESCGCRVKVIDNAAVAAELPESTTLLQVFSLANQRVVHAAAHEAWNV